MTTSVFSWEKELRNTIRPIRPKPLIPTLAVIAFFGSFGLQQEWKTLMWVEMTVEDTRPRTKGDRQGSEGRIFNPSQILGLTTSEHTTIGQ